MSPRDATAYALQALRAHRTRSALTLAGIAVGIAAVILLTSIGEGIHRFVLAEFSQFGTHIIGVHPGRSGSRGGMPSGLPSSVRPLTLDDAAALARIPGVTAVVPTAFGNAEVSARARVRRTLVYGVSAAALSAYNMRVSSGQFLPDDKPEHARPYVVLGATLKRELFGHAPALGERVRIGAQAFRVVGVLEAKGQFLGMDLDDSAWVPAARAMDLFNREGLAEINLGYAEGLDPARIVRAVEQLITARHGRLDVTTITQAEMLATLGKILDVLTMAVAALGSISLLVGSVGIVTIMTIAVTERTHEIGLLIALGASARTILALFLGEAVVLAVLGCLLGIVAGSAIAYALGAALPQLPVATPMGYVVAAVLSSVAIGLAAGVLPAQRAARLDPVQALRAD
jgi:putative ABC transport system permease protein